MMDLMSFFRRSLACLLALSMVLSSAPPASAGEVIKPQVRPTETPIVPKAELPQLAPVLPPVLQTADAPIVPATAPTEPVPALAELSAASPPPGPDQTPKTGESSSVEAGAPFTGETASLAAPPVAAPIVSREPSRSDLLVAWKKTGDAAAKAKTARVGTWLKSGALIFGGPWLAKTALSYGPGAAKAALGAMIVYGVWLMVKLVVLNAGIGRLTAQNQALLARLTRGENLRTPGEKSARIEELSLDARRHELARAVEPQLAELFAALRNYGVHDPKMAKDMDYLRRFLRELRAGERDQWTMTSMSYHLLAGSDDALDALRAQVWNDPAVGAAQVMGLEDHVLSLRKSLGTDHRPGYLPADELKFLAARMDEAYTAMLRGVDARRKTLIDGQLQRLELEELRDGRTATARGLRELRKSFDEELAALGSDPDGISEAAARAAASQNRERVDAIVSSLRD